MSSLACDLVSWRDAARGFTALCDTLGTWTNWETLDMTISTGHFERMKVSSVELKTRLGHYLHTVENSGEPIDVCIRGRVVATLFPHGSLVAQTPPGARQALLMNRALERSGLRVEPASCTGSAPVIYSQPAGDGRRDIHTVELMRKARDW